MIKIIFCFCFLALIFSSPEIFGQVETLPEVRHKSVEITIDNEGNVGVIHEIISGTETGKFTFINGTVSNVKFVKIGIEEIVPEADGVKSIPILPNQQFLVMYDLKDALYEKDNVWKWDFLYHQSTSFILPEEVDLLFVNERPVYLNDMKGINCHGCQMVLEYSTDELQINQNVKWEDEEFLVEITSNSNIENFIFDQPSKSVTFDVSEENRFVSIVIPLELLWGPYSVFSDDEKILFQEYYNNGTHVWISMVPEITGEITIIGTTVVPEFSMMIPLIIGFFVILALPFMKKFSLH